jgi:hypothetical protein
LDFVKFYIVQLVKSASARIRLADKEKEKLLSRLVSKIENSRELFPDLKNMERVIELQEAASKLISIYRRLNKSHIDLEKISYQFVSDRDSIQSILRRFLQGNYRTGFVSRKRPKIVFDDTTFTIYELKEPEVTEEKEEIVEQPKQPRIDLNEFLKDEKEEIISIKEDRTEDSTQIGKEIVVDTSNTGFEKLPSKTEEMKLNNQLEIENGIAYKSIAMKSEEKKEKTDDLVLPLQFEEEKTNDEKILDEKEFEPKSKGETPPSYEEESLNINEVNVSEEEKREEIVADSSQKSFETKETEEINLEPSEAVKDFGTQEIEEFSIDEVSEKNLEEIILTETIYQSLQTNSSGELFLDFEKLILENILKVDEFLNKALKKDFIEDEILKLINEANKCFQIAHELNYEFISELIKVYWLSLVAIRDNKIVVNKLDADLIRSTLIVLVSLIKGREIDLEPFLKKHNSLKEKLQQLQYEV